MSDERDVRRAVPAPDGALCALHPSVPADAICARCGNYMCAYCSDQHGATECLACRERVGALAFPFDREHWSVFALLDFAWQVFRHHWLKLSLVSAAMLITSQGLALFSGPVSGLPPHTQTSAGTAIWAVLLAGLQVAIQLGGQLGLYRWCLRAIAGESLEVDDLLHALRRLPQALLAAVMMLAPFTAAIGVCAVPVVLLADRLKLGLMPIYAIGAALLLLILPAAIYVGLGLVFTTLALVGDPSLDAWGAINQSWRMARSQRWRLLAAMALLTTIAVAGVVLCLVGVFPAMAYASLAMACMYNALHMKEARR